MGGSESLVVKGLIKDLVTPRAGYFFGLRDCNFDNRKFKRASALSSELPVS